MNDFVRTVFTALLGVVVALVLYVLLFGNRDFNGNPISGVTVGSKGWQGVLWYAGDAMETPISRYYYEYCYLPNIHANDYVDEALGGTKNLSYYSGNIQNTETDLSGDSDLYSFSGTNHYSTGWQ